MYAVTTKAQGGRSNPATRGAVRPVSRPHALPVAAMLRNVRDERVQAKLRISAPEDRFEQEANRVAEQVLQMQEPPAVLSTEDSLSSHAEVPNGSIQRLCAACSEDEVLLQAKGGQRANPESSAAVSTGIQALQGAGRSLPLSARRFFEPRFGVDFSQVRVHTDTRAAGLAWAFNARAFTFGRHVVFGAGEYASDNASGRRLLAHELTHVVQQHGGSGVSAAGGAGRGGTGSQEINPYPDQARDRLTEPGAAVPRLARDSGRTVSHAHIQRSPRMIQRDACTRTKPKHGPGEGKELAVTELRFLEGFAVGLKFWELSEFDIDKGFIKQGHINFLNTAKVVDQINQAIKDQGAFVAVVGEASTTGSQKHNLPLSKDRARCTIEQLISAGVPRDRIARPVGIGEIGAAARRIARGETRIDEVEDAAARKVTILLVDNKEIKPTEQCNEKTKTRRSDAFIANLACDTGSSIHVWIGDISDPRNPTYRKFKWLMLSEKTGCQFFAKADSNVPVLANLKLQLAKREPDKLSAPSDFFALTPFLATGGTTGVLGGPKPYLIPLQGIWHPPACLAKSLDRKGLLVPVSGVFCGKLPKPNPGAGCKAEACSKAHRQSSAKKFIATIIRGSGDVSRFIPKNYRWIVDWIPWKPEVSGAVVTIGTKDVKGRQLTRVFGFVGAGIHTGEKGRFEEQAGYSQVTLSSDPKQLANSDPDDILRGSSDFNGWATLSIIGGANRDELEVSGLKFAFSMARCNAESRSSRGRMHITGPVVCKDIPELREFKRDCEDDECERAGDARHFTFKTGRATLASLPLVGQKIALGMGCSVTAAFVNVGTRTDEDKQRKYREFIFVGKNADCRFEVGKGAVDKDFTLARDLTWGDPDDIVQWSDFAGKATLKRGNGMTVNPALVKFKMPGAFDAGCSGKRLVDGLMLPISGVECGQVPAPPHFTTRERTHLDRCAAFYKANKSLVDAAVAQLNKGDHDELIGKMGAGPRLGIADFDRLRSQVGTTQSKVLFVGKTGGTPGRKVVAFVDLSVLKYLSHYPQRLEVILQSNLCAFDGSANPVMLDPVNCLETRFRKGLKEFVFKIKISKIPPPVGTDRGAP
jgi:hypothetical protein